MILHQFAISHYCEKVRWALDFKGLDYTVVNYIPGTHIKKIRAIATDSMVPVLQHQGDAIQGSDQIIDWLDQHYPERSLTPTDPQSQKKVLEWERYSDLEIGIHLRRYLYHHLLESPAALIPMLSAGRPWYEKIALKLKYDKVNKLFRRYLNINEETARDSLQRVSAAIDKFSQEYEKSPYLVDNHFTRADLSAAALLAPLLRPEGYGIQWPDTFPQEILETEARLRPKLSWVDRLYTQYR